MGFNTSPLPYCKRCGKDTHRARQDESGIPITVEPKFCRHCGNPLFRPTVIPLPFISMEPDQIDFEELDEFDDWPDFSDFHNFETLEESIKAAIPENYKELSLEELRRQVVGALWKQFMGTYPSQTPEQEAKWAEHQAAMDRAHQDLMQRCIEAGTPPPLPPMASPRSRHDVRLQQFIQDYHQVWINGLTVHLSITPKEIEQMTPQLEKYGYKIKPCDCDKVRYVPDETHPHFMRKVEE